MTFSPFTNSSYGRHQFNLNGFCVKCGWEKDFLVKMGRTECGESSSTERAIARNLKYDINKPTSANSEVPRMPSRRIERSAIFIVSVPIGIFLIVAFLSNKPSKPNGVPENSNQQHSAGGSFVETGQPPVVGNSDINQSDAIPKPSTVVITRYSTGFDWRRADIQTRQQFCQTIATAESKEFNHDFTADFYYDALASFYDSSDPKILGQNIHSIVGLTTSAALAGQQ